MEHGCTVALWVQLWARMDFIGSVVLLLIVPFSQLKYLCLGNQFFYVLKAKKTIF